jgi:NADH dehydrogenase (ubiquinone) 1 beta subcomplex subunit 8
MALLRKVSSKGLCASKNLSVTYQAVRTHFNRDYMPGPFPKTEEERRAAAKKYGMLPEEYQPYPDDGFGAGDYPKLPDVSGEAKDPHYHWDFPDQKRNFGDPIHIHADAIGEDRWNISQKFRIPYATQMAVMTAIIGGTTLFYLFTYDHKLYNPVMPKQLPVNGKHYTFEPAD